MAHVSVRVLRADDRVAVPWRNGGGRTREIAVGGADHDEFDWRVSLADIDRDGPFSGYSGYSRVISIVEGDGVELTVDGVTQRLDRRSAPFTFDGSAAVMCRLLSGPVRALNVISRRSSDVEQVRPPSTSEIAAADTVVVVVVDGGAWLSVESAGTAGSTVAVGDAAELAAHDAVLVDRRGDAGDDSGTVRLTPSVVGTELAIVRVNVARPQASTRRHAVT